MATDSHSTADHPMAQTPVFLPVRAEMNKDGIKSFMKSNFNFQPRSMFLVSVFYHLRVPLSNLGFVFVKTNVNRLLNSTLERV